MPPTQVYSSRLQLVIIMLCLLVQHASSILIRLLSLPLRNYHRSGISALRPEAFVFGDQNANLARSLKASKSRSRLKEGSYKLAYGIRTENSRINLRASSSASSLFGGLPLSSSWPSKALPAARWRRSGSPVMARLSSKQETSLLTPRPSVFAVLIEHRSAVRQL